MSLEICEALVNNLPWKYRHRDRPALLKREARILNSVGFSGTSFTAVAKSEGISSTRVSQVYYRTLRKLRHPSQRQHVIATLPDDARLWQELFDDY